MRRLYTSIRPSQSIPQCPCRALVPTHRVRASPGVAAALQEGHDEVHQHEGAHPARKHLAQR
eukprot:5887039-Pyramimonas_sp.AAC.1